VLEATPFDPQRSPWDLTSIEGLEVGRAALYLRAHHALADGAGGLRMLDLCFDESASTSETTALTSAAGGRRTVTVTIDVTSAARRLVGHIAALRDAASIGSIIRRAQHGLDIADSLSRQLSIAERRPPPASIRPSLISRFELLSVVGAGTVAHALGGSRNDLLVTATAAGLGDFPQRLRTPIAQFCLSMPIADSRPDAGAWR
jgi:diacylglycerol O-acyltransferase